MKIEIGTAFPQYFKSAYPEEFVLFSHLETTSAIPSVLFAITTWKANGEPNVCFHAWSCFHGDRTAFFAVMGGLYQKTHTYANIMRDKCFCINFLPIRYYDQLIATINQNEDEADEFQVGNFTLEHAETIHAPMLMYSKEASNRKQEIDRQHHTIPNQRKQRPKDKHRGNVYNLLFRHGKVRSQNMEKLKCSFPTFCKQTFPQLHKIASYAHYAQCRLLRNPSHSFYLDYLQNRFNNRTEILV